MIDCKFIYCYENPSPLKGIRPQVKIKGATTGYFGLKCCNASSINLHIASLIRPWMEGGTVNDEHITQINTERKSKTVKEWKTS